MNNFRRNVVSTVILGYSGTSIPNMILSTTHSGLGHVFGKKILFSEIHLHMIISFLDV